uniref:Uncharacterized protein n=1 Tax=Oryza brachyantha TaxID=4533 RepID=J3KXJ2_ORYBR
ITAVQTPKRMKACAPSEPMRKRLVAMDSDGSHGTSGTPHTLGARAAGTSSWMPSVPAAHAGTSTVYPTHRSGAKPQYAAMPADEPITTASSTTSRVACVLLVTPRTYRRTRRAVAIIMKMKSVLTERRLESTSRLENKPMQAPAAAISTVACTGVPVLGCTSANTGGMMWLRAMCVVYRA